MPQVTRLSVLISGEYSAALEGEREQPQSDAEAAYDVSGCEGEDRGGAAGALG